MAGYKLKVISLTKKQGQTFGFYLRVEHGEEGHLIRCLDMGSAAELAGLQDGDRILRVNGAYVDELPHSKVVDLVKDSGLSVVFHVLDAVSYKQAKTDSVDLSDPQPRPVVNGVAHAPKPKLCYVAKTSSTYGFSLRSVIGEQGVFMAEVASGGMAEKAGVKVNDRLLEVNGESVEGATHEQTVEKVREAGGSIMFLLVDGETDRHYRNTCIKIGAGLATVKYLPLKPRLADITKGPSGFGYVLKEEPKKTGHFIKDIDRGSPAEKAGLKDTDRLVAVDGQAVEGCSHEQVVDRIKQSGSRCCLLVVDPDTDQMYKLAGVSPLLFWEEMGGPLPPPSYPEALNMSAVRPPTPGKEAEEEEVKPRLCKMEKTSTGFGFHLNGIQGVCGQYIKEVVADGAADRAGLEEDDIVIEVNGVNVENSSHEEVVALIRSSGSSLELLVATKSVYDQIRSMAPQLLTSTSSAEVHAPAPEDEREGEEEDKKEARPETPPAPARERSPSASSSSSEDSVDVRF